VRKKGAAVGRGGSEYQRNDVGDKRVRRKLPRDALINMRGLSDYAAMQKFP